MSEPIPPEALRLVASYFDAATVKSALGYVRDDRVDLIKPPPWPVVARVRGSQGYVVTVSFSASGHHLHGDCSCPVAVDCKHAAATALLVFAREGDEAARRVEAARQVVVGEWLSELGRDLGGAAGAGAGVGTVTPVPSERVIAYVIDRRDGEVAITVMQCARLAGGGLGGGTVIAALADPHRGAPAWVDTDDLRRIAMLRAVTRAAPQVLRLRLDRVHEELVRELAGTGRLFWDSTRTPPLAYGPPVREALCWCPVGGDDDGFRYGLASGLLVIGGRACHYLDAAAGVIGPLDAGVPSELVQRLISGPPVPAAMRATVERSLQPLAIAPEHSPVLSGTADDVAGVGAVMRPRLLAGLADEDAAAADRTARYVVHVVAEAQYGEERFALAEWDPARPRARDLVAEGRARDRLQALLAGLPHGARAASNRDLLADARHVAHVIVPTLRSEGWDCEVSEAFPHEAPIADVAWFERLRPVGDGRDWFAFEIGVQLAGRTVPLLPILLHAIRDGQLTVDATGAFAHGGGGLNLRLPEGELIHVPADRVRRWLRPLVELEISGLDVDGLLRVPAFVAVAIDDDAPGRFAAAGELDAARERLTGLLALAPRREGKTFRGELRPYQRVGVAWLRFLHDAGYGGVLADEMGLGKTIQVLAFLDGLRAARKLGAAAPALVVAPRTVVGNWQREAARFTPQLRTALHVGADRGEDTASLTAAPLVITSYQTLVRDLALFRAVRWSCVIFDEAQALKNSDTQVRGAAASLVAGSRFCVTGTPIENHLGELWSQIDLAMPGLLGRRAWFDAVFRRPIEKFAVAAPLAHLQQRIRPFLLRRTKDGVELDLPAKTEIVERIELDSAQRDLYESLRLSLDQRVREALKEANVQGASMQMLDAMLKLRQCCCDPRLVKVPEARKVGSSAKLERLMEMLVELADSGRATLVFSQFTSMLALIETACEQAGIATLSLTGSTRHRDDVIRRFQDGEAPVFLISLKAGGVGINLTRADTVIHYDPWWNPAVEAQATDRAHRIGQDKSVIVYKLVARGTLEDAIVALQDDKRQLTDQALRDGGASHLAASDLQALYRRIV